MNRIAWLRMRNRLRDPWRGLERRIKFGLMKFLTALVRRRTPDARPNWGARPHHVLYLRYDRIGDLVLATGIIREIALAQPNVVIDVLASTRNADVLRGNPHVRTIFRIDKSRPLSYAGALLKIRKARYDAVIDSMVIAPSLTATLLTLLSGARHRIGLGDQGNDFALTIALPRAGGARHYIEHSASLLAAFGADPQQISSRFRRCEAGAHGASSSYLEMPWRPELHLEPSELEDGERLWQLEERAGRGARLLVNVSAGQLWRYWPTERFIEILRRIRAGWRDVAILVVSSLEERERAERIAASAAATCVQTPHFRQMMALVATSTGVLTPDTSVTHVASALGKPVVSMFARGSCELYAPYGTWSRVVITPHASLDGLDVDPVARAVEELLTATGAARCRPAEDSPLADPATRGLEAPADAGRGPARPAAHEMESQLGAEDRPRARDGAAAEHP